MFSGQTPAYYPRNQSWAIDRVSWPQIPGAQIFPGDAAWDVGKQRLWLTLCVCAQSLLTLTQLLTASFLWFVLCQCMSCAPEGVRVPGGEALWKVCDNFLHTCFFLLQGTAAHRCSGGNRLWLTRARFSPLFPGSQFPPLPIKGMVCINFKFAWRKSSG